MPRPVLTKLYISLLTAGFLLTLYSLQAQSPKDSDKESEQGKSEAAKEKAQADTTPRVSLEVAREKAALLHQVYASTLDIVHRHFFRNDRAILPARAVEDIFEDVERETKIESRWIAVNTKAMSVNHEPESEFEDFVAKELADGKELVEKVEDGYFRSATPVPLGAKCVGCHTGVFSAPPKSPRMAGLIISIPIIEESGSTAAAK
ncbi:MAG: DUF3365 domain-containing protein [Planctomycetaceae bacterium]|nr:DUF3365 domain-containing protein [Planctomycetaceae bacterium]